ncbi:MAG: response regulator transcription factor [Flavobacterium sp.]|nr:response regulator transcription factor [Flavobacterium sp.]
MNILIIEDELKAAKSLITMIAAVRPTAKIVSQLQSVESVVKYFSENNMPDLIFMDIQLADGLSFDIFKKVTISCPVIFCTAYNEYSLEAFKANGIDYILKPFSREDIEIAFGKVEQLKNYFQQNLVPDIGNLLSRLDPQVGKKSFLVFKHNKYVTVPTDAIAYFCIKHEMVHIVCLDKQEYPINQSLEQIFSLLSPSMFYRLNRQYIINFNAIKEIEPYFARKLYVKLIIPTEERLLVNKEKSSSFLHWMENR